MTAGEFTQCFRSPRTHPVGAATGSRRCPSGGARWRMHPQSCPEKTSPSLGERPLHGGSASGLTLLPIPRLPIPKGWNSRSRWSSESASDTTGIRPKRGRPRQGLHIRPLNAGANPNAPASHRESRDSSTSAASSRPHPSCGKRRRPSSAQDRATSSAHNSPAPRRS